jgi:hypothetical protein
MTQQIHPQKICICGCFFFRVAYLVDPKRFLDNITISATIFLLVQSTICDILFRISYADSGDGGDGVPFEGVEICCFNLVSKLPGCNIKYEFLILVNLMYSCCDSVSFIG